MRVEWAQDLNAALGVRRLGLEALDIPSPDRRAADAGFFWQYDGSVEYEKRTQTWTV